MWHQQGKKALQGTNHAEAVSDTDKRDGTDIQIGRENSRQERRSTRPKHLQDLGRCQGLPC